MPRGSLRPLARSAARRSRQDGRRFVVTGASSGIGLETAKALAAAGAQVVLGVRNLDKGKAAAAQMSGDVEVALLDVADLSSVRAFADGVGPVDVLVNNAGVLGLPFGLSPDGVELHLATNHLGHFALANLLLPRLTDRVVVVGSASHRAGRARPRRPDVGAPPLRPLRGVRRLQARQPALPRRAPAPADRRGLDAARDRRAPGFHVHAHHVRLGQQGQAAGRGGTATGWSACRPGRVRCRRCTPPRWTCPATPTSGRTGSRR